MLGGRFGADFWWKQKEKYLFHLFNAYFCMFFLLLLTILCCPLFASPERVLSHFISFRSRLPIFMKLLSPSESRERNVRRRMKTVELELVYLLGHRYRFDRVINHASNADVEAFQLIFVAYCFRNNVEESCGWKSLNCCVTFYKEFHVLDNWTSLQCSDFLLLLSEDLFETWE